MRVRAYALVLNTTLQRLRPPARRICCFCHKRDTGFIPTSPRRYTTEITLCFDSHASLAAASPVAEYFYCPAIAHAAVRVSSQLTQSDLGASILFPIDIRGYFKSVGANITTKKHCKTAVKPVRRVRPTDCGCGKKSAGFKGEFSIWGILVCLPPFLCHSRSRWA